MGKHRKPAPAGTARRQLAAAGIGVVAVGGVLSSQLSAPNHFATHHPAGGPADLPSILAVDGQSFGAPRAAGGGHAEAAAAPDAQQPVTTVETFNTAQATGTAPEGDALAMLTHARGTHKPASRPAQKQQAPAADQDEQGQDTTGEQATAPAPEKSDHSIPDKLADPDVPQQPDAQELPAQSPEQQPQQPDSMIERLVGSLSTLDIGGALGLPARNAPAQDDPAPTEQPPHDTALPSLSGDLGK